MRKGIEKVNEGQTEKERAYNRAYIYRHKETKLRRENNRAFR